MVEVRPLGDQVSAVPAMEAWSGKGLSYRVGESRHEQCRRGVSDRRIVLWEEGFRLRVRSIVEWAVCSLSTISWSGAVGCEQMPGWTMSSTRVCRRSLRLASSKLTIGESFVVSPWVCRESADQSSALRIVGCRQSASRADWPRAEDRLASRMAVY